MRWQHKQAAARRQWPRAAAALFVVAKATARAEGGLGRSGGCGYRMTLSNTTIVDDAQTLQIRVGNTDSGDSIPEFAHYAG